MNQSFWTNVLLTDEYSKEYYSRVAVPYEHTYSKFIQETVPTEVVASLPV
jgi:hypothetical protein